MFYFPIFVEEEIVPLEEVKAETESFRNAIKEIQHWPQKIIIGNCNKELITLLLLKYVYYKIILGDNIKAKKLLLVTTDNLIKSKSYIFESTVIDSHIITDDIIDNDNNFLISDEALEKCWWILMFFSNLTLSYSNTIGFPSGANEIQNYDKYVTRKFFNNITKINTVNVTESCEYCARFVPIIPPAKKRFKFDKKEPYKNFGEPDNIINNSNIIINWLFQNCEHVETFEIGLFTATSQALYFTEGFDAFKKFITYAESLDDNNRVKVVNILIKLFNNFSRNDIRYARGDNYFYIVPKIIMALNMCDKFLTYPESIAESVFNTTVISPIFEDFRVKSRTNWQFFHNAIENFRHKIKNVIRNQYFGRKNTIPMQAIINEYDEIAKNRKIRQKN